MSPRSLLVLVLTTLSGIPASGALLWERSDLGGVTAVARDGHMAAAGTYADSVWVTQVRPDGSESWTRGWRAPVVRMVGIRVLTPTPDGGWLVGVDTSRTGVTGSWIVRLDSAGNRIGSAMGIHYDTSITVVATASATEVWMAVQTHRGMPTPLFRFSADGTPLAAPSQVGTDSMELGGLDPVAGGVLVRRDLHSGTPRVARWDLIRGTDSVWSDTIQHPGYFPKAIVVRDSLGEDKLLFLSDSGNLSYAQGTLPWIRTTVWDVATGRRSFDILLDQGFPTAAWALRAGNFRIVGNRLRATAKTAIRCPPRRSPRG